MTIKNFGSLESVSGGIRNKLRNIVDSPSTLQLIQLPGLNHSLINNLIFIHANLFSRMLANKISAKYSSLIPLSRYSFILWLITHVSIKALMQQCLFEFSKHMMKRQLTVINGLFPVFNHSKIYGWLFTEQAWTLASILENKFA